MKFKEALGIDVSKKQLMQRFTKMVSTANLRTMLKAIKPCCNG